jgi:hypothetical protein
MSAETIITRKTPFVFFRWLVGIELFFAFLPLLLAAFSALAPAYNPVTLTQSLPYPVMLTLLVAVLQILIVIVSFFIWYLPAYRISPQGIAYKSLTAADFQEWLSLAEIDRLEVHQGWMGKRFGYGTLRIFPKSGGNPVLLKDLPNPAGAANRIRGWLPAPMEGNPPEIESEAPSAEALIAAGEGKSVEFKSSILWDYHRQRANKTLSEPIIKNVTAFMNAEGGYLLVGVADDGQVLGLDADFAVMKKPNPDGFELMFNNAFNRMVGATLRRFVELRFPEVDGKTICVIRVRPATSPVYFRHQGKEQFYIRAGNAAQPLSVSEAANYIQERFARD